MFEQIFKDLVSPLLESEESENTRRHLANASYGVRQIPDLDIRSFLFSIFTHVISEDGVLEFAVVTDKVEMTKAKTMALALKRNVAWSFMLKFSRFLGTLTRAEGNSPTYQVTYLGEPSII